jgi:hypothetical protein
MRVVLETNGHPTHLFWHLILSELVYHYDLPFSKSLFLKIYRTEEGATKVPDLDEIYQISPFAILMLSKSNGLKDNEVGSWLFDLLSSGFVFSKRQQ